MSKPKPLVTEFGVLYRLASNEHQIMFSTTLDSMPSKSELHFLLLVRGNVTKADAQKGTESLE